MKIKLGFIGSFPIQTKIVKEVATLFEDEIELFIDYGILEDAIPKAKRFVSKGAEVIVALGGTAKMLEKEIDIPVISIKIGILDLIKAIENAKKFGNNIGLTTEVPINGLEIIEKLYDIKIKQIIFSNKNDFIYGITSAINEGTEVIIGKSNITLETAAEYKIKGVLVTFSRESLTETIEEAIKTAKMRRKEKEQYLRLQTIFNSLTEGIIAIDREGRITDFNHAAETIFKVKSHEVFGKKSSNKFPKLKLTEILEGKSDSKNEIINIGHTQILFSALPVIMGKNIVGAVATLRKASEIQKMDSKIRKKMVSRGFAAHYTIDHFSTKSSVMKKVIDTAKKYAPTDFNILLIGESGTGKEVLAQSIHQLSKRKKAPFVAINCSVVPENLLESELFGYEEGAFTGAKKGGKLGLFEIAHGGTIFLDEIGSMPAKLQAKLLRVLQEKEVMRLGGERIVPVDVRVIAATNQDIAEAVKDGRFRKDLYYRLNVLTINLPTLRERKEDIPEIIEVIMHEQCKKFNKKPFNLSKSSIKKLVDFPWDGNVRELENIISRMVLLCENNKEVDSFIEEEWKKVSLFPNQIDNKERSFTHLSIKDLEIERLITTLKECGFNISKAASRLGISRSTLYRKMKSLHFN